jgi:hypothetical protein
MLVFSTYRIFSSKFYISAQQIYFTSAYKLLSKMEKQKYLSLYSRTADLTFYFAYLPLQEIKKKLMCTWSAHLKILVLLT